MKTTYIYILIDPVTNQVRYVGKTNHPKKRFNEHVSKCTRTNTHNNCWLVSLKNKNLKPEMVVIDESIDESWQFLEQWYIELFKSWGFNLTNTAKGGGGGGGITSKEHAEKIAIKLRGIKRSPEFCKKISDALRKRVISEETREKMRISAKNRIISKETREKMVKTRLENGNYVNWQKKLK